MSAEGWATIPGCRRLHYLRGDHSLCRAQRGDKVSATLDRVRHWPRPGAACVGCWDKRSREELQDLEAQARARGVVVPA